MVGVHDSIRLSARVRRSDNQEVDLPVAWIPSAGTMTQQGMYAPPDSAGEYRIIAAVLGHNLNDTVYVSVFPDTVTPPPPPELPDTSITTPPDTTVPPPPPEPPPGTPDTTDSAPPPPPVGPQNVCGNEPAGLTPITERGFDEKVENGWESRGGANFSIVQDEGALRSSPNVGEARYPAGFPAGQGPIATWFFTTTSPRTLYACLWIKLSNSWIGNVTGVNKVIFFSIAGGNRVFLNARGTGAGPLSAEIDFQAMGATDAAAYQHGVSWNGYANLNRAAATLTRGAWAKWEVLLVANTPGQFDGEAHWWIDGNKVGRYTSIGFSGGNETGGNNIWAGLLWNPTYGGGGPAVVATQYMWIDHIYVSGK